ncbi:hypothetical protein BT96DRAFT_80979 [Gymnopus androsaceus JB14]|uniref:Uncharacterized protein n=1 Tax=Gymnopus androsaceus JB14 TaxID=1447944 RepID=A0A6A4IEX1_9AGAR|nr:hypothetical protein BT96DRAFT_80979 [Gymnopus androsaceus JB14]
MVRCPQSHPGAGVPSRGLCENALRRPDSLCSLLPFPHHLSQCWHILTSVQTTSFEFTVSQIQGSARSKHIQCTFRFPACYITRYQGS